MAGSFLSDRAHTDGWFWFGVLKTTNNKWRESRPREVGGALLRFWGRFVCFRERAPSRGRGTDPIVRGTLTCVFGGVGFVYVFMCVMYHGAIQDLQRSQSLWNYLLHCHNRQPRRRGSFRISCSWRGCAVRCGWRKIEHFERSRRDNHLV